MKKILILLIILLSVAFSFSESKKVILAAVEQPPFYSETLKDNGYISKVIRESFKASGYTVEINFMTWARGVEEVKHGRIDGLFGLWYREDRNSWLECSMPLPLKDEMVIFANRNSKISYNKYSDLRLYEIGVVSGYSFPKEFLDAGLNFKSCIDETVALYRLVHNKVDLAVVNKEIGLYLLKTKYPGYADKIVILGKPINSEYEYIGFSKQVKDYKEKLKAFNDGLKKITENGTLKKILDNK